ncbi:hypothetical protein TNCV_3025461 [Trichonephila clavipes]|nr:hypothetical protein TNCV_3025461 [Trichonephila clavipes]
MSDIGRFLDIFWTISSAHSRARSVGVYNPMTDFDLLSSENSTHASPVQSNCDAHDTIANGQYGAVWSMGHTQQVCVRIVLPPQTSGNSFAGDLLSEAARN